MTIQQIAARLVELNRIGDYLKIYEELYDTENIVSVENWGEREEFRGIAAVKAKAEKYESSVETVHEMNVSEPLVADKSFAVTFYMDTTYKADSDMPGRMQMTELAIYRVNDEGKIYHEEFSA